MRDHAAHRHPRIIVQQRHDGLEHFAADVLEIHIDTVWARGLELRRKIRCAVVDTGIKPEFVLHVAALFRAARDANGARTLDLRDLPNHRTDSAGSRRDHQRLARLRLADFRETEIGRHARHTEYAQRI